MDALQEYYIEIFDNGTSKPEAFLYIGDKKYFPPNINSCHFLDSLRSEQPVVNIAGSVRDVVLPVHSESHFPSHAIPAENIEAVCYSFSVERLQEVKKICKKLV